VPPTPEEFRAQDKDLMMKLSEAWIDGISGVSKDAPLPESSPAGEPSPVASIPMEPLSESQESLPVPS
jgi:hypothetical protein